jgi:hypothetical protein
MSVGLSLLLIAVLIWWNFNQLLHGKATNDSLSSTFLTISRKVTPQNMGQPAMTVFSGQDIADLRRAPEVEDVGIVQALKPSAYMNMEIASGQGFSTVIILEAVPDRFMDKRPAEWGWQPGSATLPVILSSSFFSLYNYVFAPSQGLPQLSEETIKALPFKLSVGDGTSAVTYIAHVAGFSDRITSVLVPESFVQHANGSQGPTTVSRLIVKVADPSSTAFANYLDVHGYVTNSELMRWSKVREIVQVVAGITGGLALLLLGVSLLVFVLFVELTIARARHSVQLLQEIGYSPATLRAYLSARFLPLVMIAIFSALAVAIIAQVAAHYLGIPSGLHFAIIPGWPMWLCLLIVCILLLLQMRGAIARAIRHS